MGWNSLFSVFLVEKSKARLPTVLDVPFDPKIPANDEDEKEAFDSTLPESLQAEGQSFVIGYENSKGIESSRRIVVWGIKRTAQSKMVLYARCMETNSMRSFRADRIRYCVDINGEIFEPPANFLADAFGLGPSDLSLLVPDKSDVVPAPRDAPDQDYTALKKRLRHELVLLSAMSECDGQISLTETAAVLDYVGKRATEIGIALTESREKKLRGFIRRLRPTEDQITEAIDIVSSKSVDQQMGIVVACNEVMLADGLVRAEELELLEQIRSEILGC